MTDGVPVDVRTDDQIRGGFVKVVDFKNLENNYFLIVNQFSVQGSNGSRRLDIVVFINGLPMAVLELKNPADEDADIWKAFEQMGTFELPLTKVRRFLLHRQTPRTRVPRSYTVSTSFTSRSPYGRSVFVPTNPIYYDILQKTIFFFLAEGRGLTSSP